MPTKTLPILTLSHELTAALRGAKIIRLRSWYGNLAVQPEWNKPIARIYKRESGEARKPEQLIILALNNGVMLQVDPNLDPDPDSPHDRVIVHLNNNRTIEGLGGFCETYSLTEFSKHGRFPAIYRD